MAYKEIGYEPLGDERPTLLARLVRLNRYIFVLLIIPVTGLMWRPPVEQQREKERTVHELEVRRDVLREKASRLKERFDLLKNPDYLEIEARDRLHLRMSGETIVRFENE